MKTISVAQARAQLSAEVESVNRTHDVVSITRNGEPAAVLLSAEDWESIQETLYWSEPTHAAELQAAIDEARESEKMTLAEAFPDFVPAARKSSTR